MAEPDRSAVGDQLHAIPCQGHDRIAYPQRRGDPPAIGRPREPGESRRQRHLGEFRRAVRTRAEDHQPFGRMLAVGLAVRRRHAVEPARQQRDDLAVWGRRQRRRIGDRHRPRLSVERAERRQHGAPGGDRGQADVRGRQVVVDVARDDRLRRRHGQQRRRNPPSSAHRRSPLLARHLSASRAPGKTSVTSSDRR